MIATAGATTAGGEGQLTFPVFDAPGLYLLRLRLSTAHGVAEDRLWIDRRHDLSDRDGKAAIVAAYVRTVGDRTAGHEIRTSGCGHYAYNVVDCLLLRSDYRGDLYSGGDRYWRTLRPFGFRDASRPVGDAVRTTLQRIRLTPPPAKLDLPARERPGAQLAVTAHFTLGPSWEEGSPQQSNVLACVAIGHARTGGRIRFAKPLGSTWFGRAWNVVMPVPRRYAATLRHWLDGPRHIFALVTATATSGGFEPPTTVQVMRSTRLTP